MAETIKKYLDLAGTEQVVDNLKEIINKGDAKSYKSAKFDDTTRILSLYKAETTTGTADFTVEIPEKDVSGFLEKLTTSNAGNVIITKADGTVEDGGVALTNLAAKSELSTVDTKIGDITTLTTTSKTDVVSAVNELVTSVGNAGTASEITVDTTATTDGYLKSYTIKQGGINVATIDIPKDLVVQSGSVAVNPEGQAAGTYIKLVIANQTEPLYINVGTLVDIYKAKENAVQIQVVIDSSTREISAAVVAGSVGTTELTDKAVTTIKIADANVTLAKLASDVTAAFDSAGSAVAAETNAKTYVDGLNTAMDARVDTLETKIGDGFEAITVEEINELFT